MPLYFFSSADGNDANSGLTLDLAWATLEHALEAGGLTAGDSVAGRKTHSEIPTNDITPIYDGTAENPITIFGCPRAAHAISSSDWTNGSTAVVVDDADMVREQHQSRYITAPDGSIYFITRVVGASNIVLDGEYAGSTSLNDATASINADTTQSAWDDYDDSADTIKKADWEADADTLPVIDFNDGAFQVDPNGDQYHSIYCIEFKDSSDASGLINFRSRWFMEGCLFKQSTQNTEIILVSFAEISLKRCTFEGSGSGAAQSGINSNNGTITMKDVAIYNCGDAGIAQTKGLIKLKNVNIGVEQANGDDDISNSGGQMQGVDVKLGGSNGLVTIVSSSALNSQVSIENYQKVLDENRTFYPSGYYERVAVAGETPNKKISDYVLKVTPNVNVVPTQESAPILLYHEVFSVTTGAKTFKYWLYNDTGDTLNDTTALDNIFIKASVVDSYDDTTEYTKLDVFSTEIDILDAADADDWDSLSVTLTPAVTSKVSLEIYARYYNAATNFFIDPAVVIT